ncbi:hypothetical protein [Rarobacter incanus]|uniref:Periplasmic binding protein domain-containing protein n=1 Tax=Rarobacter incanus TaxID=153494 RepID=A0A542SN44_9MICO|nr:hypothetical protein [Rarobacter incanus]TQK76040.1 hypothetical protein FB389_0694 [Rarobacter incanus]
MTLPRRFGRPARALRRQASPAGTWIFVAGLCLIAVAATFAIVGALDTYRHSASQSIAAGSQPRADAAPYSTLTSQARGESSTTVISLVLPAPHAATAASVAATAAARQGVTASTIAATTGSDQATQIARLTEDQSIGGLIIEPSDEHVSAAAIARAKEAGKAVVMLAIEPGTDQIQYSDADAIVGFTAVASVATADSPATKRRASRQLQVATDIDQAIAILPDLAEGTRDSFLYYDRDALITRAVSVAADLISTAQNATQRHSTAITTIDPVVVTTQNAATVFADSPLALRAFGGG